MAKQRRKIVITLEEFGGGWRVYGNGFASWDLTIRSALAFAERNIKALEKVRNKSKKERT